MVKFSGILPRNELSYILSSLRSHSDIHTYIYKHIDKHIGKPIVAQSSTDRQSSGQSHATGRSVDAHTQGFQKVTTSFSSIHTFQRIRLGTDEEPPSGR